MTMPTNALSQRWRGQANRLEAWYATLSDRSNGIGLWVHHEMVAPSAGEPYAHGWTALFRPSQPVVLERFGPSPAGPHLPTDSYAPCSGSAIDPPGIRGSAGRLAWDLHWGTAAVRPLWTFPSWAWQREVLPAAQVVPVPNASFQGTIALDGETFTLSGLTRGNLAHIYGHGSAERWGWLHADLGGGDVLEIVSAVSRRPAMNRLPPLAFIQLRLGEHDWPRDPLLAAPLFRTQLGLPRWEVSGALGRWRLRVEVEIPPQGAVEVGYVDPDGATATCTNSEIANALVVLEHRRNHWEIEHEWSLRGTAHSEIGTRP